MDHTTKKYHPINEELVLFNDEYYVSVMRVPVDQYDASRLAEVFNELFAFQNNDIEVEVDISEESEGTWYVQFLVPYMLTLSDAAIKRIARGSEALKNYLQERSIHLSPVPLRGEEIFAYIKRYNPGLAYS